MADSIAHLHIIQLVCHLGRLRIPVNMAAADDREYMASLLWVRFRRSVPQFHLGLPFVLKTTFQFRHCQQHSFKCIHDVSHQCLLHLGHSAWHLSLDERHTWQPILCHCGFFNSCHCIYDFQCDCWQAILSFVASIDECWRANRQALWYFSKITLKDLHY